MTTRYGRPPPLDLLEMIALPDVPPKPYSGWKLYFDNADNRFKYVGTDGNVRTLQAPAGVQAITTAITVANTASETQLVGYTIPASFLVVGTTFRIQATGVLSDDVVAPTSTFRVRLGPTTLTGNILTTLAPAGDINLSAVGWQATALMTVRTSGAGGTAIGQGSLLSAISVTYSKGAIFSTGVGTQALDTTVSNVLELTFQWGTAAAANTMSCNMGSIEVVKM